MEVYSWENHLFLWAICSMAMLNNQMVNIRIQSYKWNPASPKGWFFNPMNNQICYENNAMNSVTIGDYHSD
jgi:hypothetical protein